MPATRKRKPLLDLHVPQDPDGTVAATMPLAWCFKEGSDLAQQVQDRNFEKPHLLVVVRKSRLASHFDADLAYETWSDHRATVVPLVQGLQYLSFSSPGENQILAYVVNAPTKERLKDLVKTCEFINKGGSRGDSSFSDDGAPSEYGLFRDQNFLSKTPDVLTVHVPAEMFAPEPAQWRKNLVARVFRTSSAVDQCHFRKKFLISLPAIPIMLLGLALGKLLFFGLGIPLLAPRRLAWKTMFKPFAGPIDVVDDSPDANSWFFMNSRADEYRTGDEWRIGWQSFLSPLVWLLPASLVWLALHAPVHYTGSNTRTHPLVHTGPYWKFVITFDVIAVLLPAAAVVVGFVLTQLVRKIAGLESPDRKQKRREKERARRERERLAMIAELEKMACGTEPPPMSVRDLPSDKQTVYLRFADLKTRVCKPFAR